MRVVIAGGHGKIALNLEQLLTRRGDSVAGFIRNPDHAADLQAGGAQPLVVDLENASVDDVASHLEGADAVGSLCMERMTSAPFGLLGGEAGAAAVVTLSTPDGASRHLPSKGAFNAPAGSVIVTCLFQSVKLIDPPPVAATMCGLPVAAA